MGSFFLTGSIFNKGLWLGVPVPGIHNDERFYINTEVYDPFRFVSSSLQAAESPKGNFPNAEYRKCTPLSMASDTFLPFGYARHSWYVLYFISFTHREYCVLSTVESTLPDLLSVLAVGLPRISSSISWRTLRYTMISNPSTNVL